jgi:hypothetical protein
MPYLVCLIPSLNGTPSMQSANWFDPSNFLDLGLALKISLKLIASAVFRPKQ